jgi:flagellum-specific peptidoglycan hydrolase FlgJ
MNWNLQIAKAKHETRKTLFFASHALHVNGWRIVTIMLVGLIILRKDISLSLNLKSPTHFEQNLQNAIPVNEAAELTKNVVQNDVIETLKNVSTTSKVAKNEPMQSENAVPFSNIAFVLNPTYAKRNNINPSIVAQKNQVCKEYVNRFSAIAVEEMKKYGIPASITLAQGLLESDAGQSRLATNNNNHFGIKCFSANCPQGHCSNHSDDSHKDFFRKYDRVWESYRAHSLFLQRSRYQHLKKIPHSDYKSWAKELSKAGYATDKKYADKLIALIENMKLYHFDK